MSGEQMHDFSKSYQKWKKRKLPNRSTPYIISLRLSDEQISDMEDVREYQTAKDDTTDWNCNSMLIRRCIKLAKAYITMLKSQEEEKKQKGGVV